MAKNPPDEKLVYLALRSHFKGPDAQLRRLKKIREIVQKYRGHGDLHNLIQEHTLDTICVTAKTLLEQRIFESTLKAKLRFPDVFKVSPGQSAERAASEAEAAKSEEHAIKDAAAGHQSNLLTEEGLETKTGDKGKEKAIASQVVVHPPPLRPVSHATISVPSLYPVYLSYDVQHQLLVKVQGLLETACYHFAEKSLNVVLEKEAWDCPAAAELNSWAKIFRNRSNVFSGEAIHDLGKPLAQVLDSITQLRHTAVHRLRVSVTRIEQFMLDSESLARLLEDDACVRTLSRLRHETDLTIGELKRNKDLLESTLAETLKKIWVQRAELEQLEHKAIQDMLREDREYQQVVGANLFQTITAPETMVHSAATTENETPSELDSSCDVDSSDEREVGPTESHTSSPDLAVRHDMASSSRL